MVAALTLCSCSHESIITVGYTQWDESLNIKKSLLECGAPNISNIRVYDEQNKKYLSDNEVAGIVRCMENNGFTRKTSTTCQLFPDLPVCLNDGDVPVMEASKRLNGSYCKNVYDPLFQHVKSKYFMKYDKCCNFKIFFYSIASAFFLVVLQLLVGLLHQGNMIIGMHQNKKKKH